MFYKDYEIGKDDMLVKPFTVLSRKLPSFLRCYTVRNVQINPEECSVTFKKSYRVNMIKIDSHETHKVFYEVLDKNDRLSILRLKI
jgi:hypothetical protein